MDSSVIITTYKRPDFLRRAVESVLSQTVAAEIVVVDDNGLGTDMQIETASILQDLMDLIIYIPLVKNSGACTARNRGVESATGEYLFFLDDDDVFLPRKVEVQKTFLERNSQYDGCAAAFKRIDEKGKEINAQSNFPTLGNINNFVIKGNLFTPMLCIRKTSFLKVGGFSIIPRFQDKFFIIKALLTNCTFAEIDEQLHVMYEHHNERVTLAGIEKTRESLGIIKQTLQNNKGNIYPSSIITFEHKTVQMIATTHYTSALYLQRLAGVPLWIEYFVKTGDTIALKLALKSILKFR